MERLPLTPAKNLQLPTFLPQVTIWKQEARPLHLRVELDPGELRGNLAWFPPLGSFWSWGSWGQGSSPSWLVSTPLFSENSLNTARRSPFFNVSGRGRVGQTWGCGAKTPTSTPWTPRTSYVGAAPTLLLLLAWWFLTVVGMAMAVPLGLGAFPDTTSTQWPLRLCCKHCQIWQTITSPRQKAKVPREAARIFANSLRLGVRSRRHCQFLVWSLHSCVSVTSSQCPKWRLLKFTSRALERARCGGILAIPAQGKLAGAT